MRTAFSHGNYITARRPTDQTRSGRQIRSLSDRLRQPPTPESQHTPRLKEGSYAELVSGYDTESGSAPHSSEDSEDRPRRFDSMSSSDDSEKDVQHVRFVSGRGQNAKAFLRDIELGVHAGGKHITHMHSHDGHSHQQV